MTDRIKSAEDAAKALRKLGKRFYHQNCGTHGERLFPGEAEGCVACVAPKGAKEIKRLRAALIEIETYAANHQTEFDGGALGFIIATCQMAVPNG